MIHRGIRILIVVYDTYINSECCEPCSFFLVNILIQNIVQVFSCILSLYILHM